MRTSQIRRPVMTVILRESSTTQAGPGHRPIVLVIDGDTSSRSSLAGSLSVGGYDVVTASNGQEGVLRATSSRPTLVLLDMHLPDQSGHSVLRQITAQGAVPVIMMTIRHDRADVVAALDAGAADLVVKPVHHRELTARVRSVLRRISHRAAGTSVASVYRSGPVRIDLPHRTATVLDRPVDLTRQEFDLLSLLVLETARVVPLGSCLELLWDDHRMADRHALEGHIDSLRHKIEPVPSAPRHIVTVPGIGYRFRP